MDFREFPTRNFYRVGSSTEPAVHGSPVVIGNDEEDDVALRCTEKDRLVRYEAINPLAAPACSDAKLFLHPLNQDVLTCDS